MGCAFRSYNKASICIVGSNLMCKKWDSEGGRFLGLTIGIILPIIALLEGFSRFGGGIVLGSYGAQWRARMGGGDDMSESLFV